ncbi:SMR family transporter [Pectobacterium brasiliense]|uniref:DMT family transporter n=1 Tax=Pectobacterium TaxID=122277 RepID=UPI001F2EADA7|nr:MULTISPECIES: SMR family transporter [Pectobacterium]
MVVPTLIFGAICSTLGTLALKGSERFRKPIPTALALLCYAGSTVLLARAMTLMPVALAHAVWTGLVALALLGIDRFYFRLPVSGSRLAGFLCVLGGIAVLGAQS